MRNATRDIEIHIGTKEIKIFSLQTDGEKEQTKPGSNLFHRPTHQLNRLLYDTGFITSAKCLFKRDTLVLAIPEGKIHVFYNIHVSIVGIIRKGD
jgi:hypothetical protein